MSPLLFENLSLPPLSSKLEIAPWLLHECLSLQLGLHLIAVCILAGCQLAVVELQ
jgi:hypothetical protein